MTKQKGIRREEEEEEEKDRRVREWEEGLPSLADLISLSQCLISPQLASAFSITSPCPSLLPTRSPADTVFSSLACTSHVYPEDHTPCTVEDPLHGVEASPVNHHPQLCAEDRSPHVADVSERIYNGNLKSIDRVHSDEIHVADFTALDAKERSHGGGVSVREWVGNFQPANAGHLRSYGGDASVGKYYGSSAPLDGCGGGDLRTSERSGDGDDEGEGEGHACANAGICISDSSNVASRVDADNEAEEEESTPSPVENPNAEATARTLKRPRLVWTPELHKRFVDAVSHLGVKTAVPKTIMQLMNVEGLTRENVASHLQKYRLYLKRMQGLSNEGSPLCIYSSTCWPCNAR